MGSPEMRAEARRLKLKAAAEGERAPVQVLPGNHHVCTANAPGGTG